MFRRLFSDAERGFWRFFCDTKILACVELDEAEARLCWLLEALNGERPLILTDAGVRATRFFRRLTDSLQLPVIEIDGRDDRAWWGRRSPEIEAHRADLVIAIGGGSVLDAGKWLAACLGGELEPQMLPDTEQIQRPPLPLIAVPTTFGTGSEVNGVTHLRLGASKHSLRRHWLAPAVALLVGEAGIEMPSRLRYLTGLDAWVHAFEALTLKRENSPLMTALLLSALDRHRTHFRAFVDRPDPVNGLVMAESACLAGLAINNARTGLIHTLAVPFEAWARVAHPVSLLPFIRPVLAFNRSALPQFKGWHPETELAELDDFLLWRMPEILAGELDGLPKPSEIAWMARQCGADSVILKENPVRLAAQDFQPLYQEAFSELLRLRLANL